MTRQPEFDSQQGQGFFLWHHAQTSPGPHPSLYPFGFGASFPGINLPGRQADHTPPSVAEVKNAWSCTSIVSSFHGVVCNLYPHHLLVGLLIQGGLDGHVCGTHGEREECVRIFVRKPKENRPFGRPGRKCKVSVKTGVK
jgi:hypothetical protein